MIDFQIEMFNFYDKHVRLSKENRRQLANFREINLRRLNNSLTELGYPLPLSVVNQGSYATFTTTNQPENAYDIDIAVIFKAEDLPSSPYDARKLIKYALLNASGNFSKPPEARTNAVTVWYQEGYHVDLAVHRLRENNWGEPIFEHAGVEWKKRDPQGLTKWFINQVSEKSPTKEMGASVPEGQMRRLVQLIKFFCKSRRSLSLPGGLIISVLVDECYKPDFNSDSKALHNTLLAINERLGMNTEIFNPVDIEQILTYKDEYRNQVNNLREQLDVTLPLLDPLKDSSSDKEVAAKSWKDFFEHKYWNELLEEIEQSKALGQSLQRGTFVTSAGHVTSSKPDDGYVKTRPHKYFGG